MSARGEEAGEASGSQEPDPEPESELEPATAAAEPQKRKPGRPRKPQKVSSAPFVNAVFFLYFIWLYPFYG